MGNILRTPVLALVLLFALAAPAATAPATIPSAPDANLAGVWDVVFCHYEVGCPVSTVWIITQRRPFWFTVTWANGVRMPGFTIGDEMLIGYRNFCYFSGALDESGRMVGDAYCSDWFAWGATRRQ